MVDGTAKPVGVAHRDVHRLGAGSLRRSAHRVEARSARANGAARDYSRDFNGLDDGLRRRPRPATRVDACLPILDHTSGVMGSHRCRSTLVAIQFASGSAAVTIRPLCVLGNSSSGILITPQFMNSAYHFSPSVPGRRRLQCRHHEATSSRVGTRHQPRGSVRSEPPADHHGDRRDRRGCVCKPAEPSG